MKRLENLLLKACAFTVLIVLLFFLFTLATDFTEAAITIGTFMIILAFGIIVAVANLVLDIKPLKFIYRLLIHYAVLLIAFIIIFVINGKVSTGGAAAVFSAVVIFTLLYAVFFIIAHFIKRSISSADKRLDKKHPKKVVKKKEYKSLYK